MQDENLSCQATIKLWNGVVPNVPNEQELVLIRNLKRWFLLKQETDDCCRLVLLCNAVNSIQQTEKIPNDPPWMGAKSTTISNHRSTAGIQ